MEHSFSTYKVEIKNLKYINDKGFKFPKTAIITLYDESNKEAGTELLGNIDTADIYTIINEGGDLNLDNCYIEDFSLSFYRQHFNLDKKELIKLNGFSAKNTFFDAHLASDFTLCDFGDGDVSFEGSIFVKGDVLFHASIFGEGNVIFSGISILVGNVDFSGVVVESGDFVFKNSFI